MLIYTIEDFVNLLNGTTKGRLVRDSIGHKGIRRIPESPQLKGNPHLEDCPIQQVYEMFIGSKKRDPKY